jgi:Holliday junction resolvase RusA-like endonuclease
MSTTRRRTCSTALERDFVIVPKETGQALVFTVYGEPVPLPRHRLSRGRMFNPSATLQKDFAAACAAKLPLTPLEGAIEATLLFYFKRPKTHYGTGKNAQTMKPAAVAAGEWHSKKKDLDNLVKFVLDSLNGRAYVDDAQVGVWVATDPIPHALRCLGRQNCCCAFHPPTVHTGVVARSSHT